METINYVTKTQKSDQLSMTKGVSELISISQAVKTRSELRLPG